MQLTTLLKVGLAFIALSLAKADECPPRTLVLPNRAKYNKHCGGQKGYLKSSWTCFHHIEGNLHNVKVMSTFPTSKDEEDGGIWASDGDLFDFTTKELAQNFQIHYLYKGLRFIYNRAAGQNCYHISIDALDDPSYRLQVATEVSRPVLIDSKGTVEANTCARDLFLDIFWDLTLDR
ncbi:uncharacterized protein UTRI_10065 [Ustilago trichophora]|uniref:Mig1 protein n=1 Tax=Ustilago trichophora TaxID=86804 RepID=A0A5C3DXH5_9BASI|nr:uncharacterized protein UTRI_10065 [Ustilago trichophora]